MTRGTNNRARIAALALGAAAAAGPALALPAERGVWIRVDTENFTLYSDASRHRAVKVGRSLEQLRAVLAKTTAGMTLHAPVPSRLFLFKDEESFRPYDLGGADWSGYFIAARDGNYVAVDASTRTRPLDVVYHEYLHSFLRNNVPQLPLWLNEGLAEFYSSFEVRGGRAEIGRPIERHLFWLARNELIPLRELFALDTESSAYNEGTRQGTVYAQSWALTHWLLADESRRAEMGRLLALLNGGTDAAEALEAVLGRSAAEIERELASYVRRESFGFYRYTPDVEIDTGLVRIRRLERQEVLYLLGDLLAHHPDAPYEAAEQHLRAALALEGAGARIHAALARIRLEQERPREAVELSRRALELDEEDAAAHSVHGRALLALHEAEGGTDDLLEARRHLRRCAELHPDDVETLADLGRSFLFGHGDPAEGISALTRAAQALPYRVDILLELIALTAGTGDTDGARSLLENALRPRAGAEAVRTAEAAITNVEIRSAMRLLQEGRRGEAEALVRHVAERTHDPGIKLRLLAQLMEWSTELASTRSIDLFNDAVEKARRGEMEQAASMLETLLESAEQPDLRAAAETHLREIRRTLGHNRLVARFNEAVRLANRGRPDEATAILQEMLESQPPGDLRRQTLDLLHELRLASSAGAGE
jgi:tetratricopeptide (TPR) repeat protein